MSRGKAWTHDELMIAMNLYCKLPFGQLHHRNPLIADVASKLGRTPGSLAMKLCNFASLDPVQQARGIKGLAGVSNADRTIWTDFHENWEDLATQSESLVENLTGEQAEWKRPRGKGQPPGHAHRRAPIQPSATTEAAATVRARRGQDFFRQTVLASYGYRCCVTGNPVPELLVASHIMPWSEFAKERLNPRNGVCLAATHDAAFDRGLVTFDEDHRLVLSRHLKDFESEASIKVSFSDFEGKTMRLPDKFAPDESFLDYHRQKVFRE